VTTIDCSVRLRVRGDRNAEFAEHAAQRLGTVLAAALGGSVPVQTSVEIDALPIAVKRSTTTTTDDQ
jgi:hypothetical protein